MSALALSLGFFLFLTFLGRATLALCHWRGGVLRAWLLAPAAGLATAVLAIMVLNQAGLPVRAFAWPMTAYCTWSSGQASVKNFRTSTAASKPLSSVPFWMASMYRKGRDTWPIVWPVPRAAAAQATSSLLRAAAWAAASSSLDLATDPKPFSTGTFVTSCSANPDSDRIAHAWEESLVIAQLTGKEDALLAYASEYVRTQHARTTKKIVGQRKNAPTKP